MRISLIMAVSFRDGVIGKDGRVPWRLRSDMLRFKQLTEGHLVVMGRKTWDSLPAKFRPLPGRGNIVLTRDQSFQSPGALPVHNPIAFAALLEMFRHIDHEVFVIGGAEIYTLFLPYASIIYLTEVQARVEGDTYFPYLERLSDEEWKVIRQEQTENDEHDEYVSTFMELRRRDVPPST